MGHNFSRYALRHIYPMLPFIQQKNKTKQNKKLSCFWYQTSLQNFVAHDVLIAQ